MGTEGDVIGARILAYIVDTVVIGVVVFALALVFGLLGAGFGSRGVFGAGLLVAGLVGLLLQFGYFIYFEGKSGQTPGKRLLDIVVVHEDGSACDYGSATVRNLLRIVDQLGIVIPYLVALILIFLTDDNQRIGDIVADTVVVKAE
ncbi:RDD domain-containing protein [Candidatus Halobonum tyrrellensis G22]|uniref:RDD domain-containing protein n=2 Tax=Candidatus Halobonum TaxID=1431544 RepID=V4HEU2_9EURY|nr:RDD domain-containing protein [Candidatus Halobonum tyrrellensis G22]